MLDQAQPVVRFIIHTISSVRDMYGNTYTFAYITSTKTGKTIKVNDTSLTNCRQLIREALGSYVFSCYPYTFSVEQTVPKREWKEKDKVPGIYEHQITTDRIKNLEEFEEYKPSTL